VSSIQSSALFADQMHELWETLRCLYGPGEDGTPAAPTADILRYPASGITGHHYAFGNQGTPTLEPGLDGLEVAVSPPGLYAPTNRDGRTAQLQEGERLFLFKNIPATANHPANTIYATDQISFEGKTWAHASGREVWNDTVSEISLMFCVEVRP